MSKSLAARLARLLIAAGLPLWVAACGGGGGDDRADGPEEPDDPYNPVPPPAPPPAPASCSFIAGGSTAIDISVAGCASCDVSNLAAAIDGDPTTFATISFPPGTGGVVALRATAQEGIAYPALSDPGAILSTSGSGETVINRDFSFTTYLQGVPTGSSQDFGVDVGTGGGSSTPQRYGFSALPPGPFDAVELNVSFVAGLGEHAIHVHEFCSGD